MSEYTARGATGLAVVFVLASVVLVVQGRHFLAGFFLTLVAFAIYIREQHS